MKVRSGVVGATTISLERVDDLARQAAGLALVDARRIGEAVADHPQPGVERGPDRLVEVIGARGIEQQRLRERRVRRHLRVENDGAQRLGERRAARLARQHRVDADAPQLLGERPGLGRLSRPLPAFEGDELAEPP